MIRKPLLGFAVVLFGIIAISAAPALAIPANPFTDLSTAGAGPGNYAILGLGGGQVKLSNVTVNGNVGIGVGGTVNNMAPSTINGNVYQATAGQYSNGPGILTGTVITDPGTLSTNVSGAYQAASDAAGLTATQTITGDITSGTTITGVSGLNVINVTGGINLNNANLTLTGPSDAQFVVNVGGNLTLGGTASLITSGGVDTSNILYNFTATNAGFNTHVGDNVYGIMLAAGSSSNMNLDGNWYGELIGQSINLLSDSTVTSPPTVPEPSTIFLLAAGLLGLLAVSRKFKTNN